MLEALFELFVPLVVSAIIDHGVEEKNIPYIIRMCLLMVTLALIGLICSVTAQFFAAKAAVGTAMKLRSNLFRHIEGLSFTELDGLGTSTLITRMTSDINQIQNGINMVLRLFLRSPFIVFGAMIMAFTIDVKAAFIFVIAIPVLSVVVFGIMLITKPLYKKVQEGLDQILGITRENLSGARVLRAFHIEDKETIEFQTKNEELNLLQRITGRIAGLMNPFTYVIINVAIIALIYVGAIRVNTGILTQGMVVALYNYMSQILVELIKLANLIVTVTKAIACANRVSDTFEIESSMVEGGCSDLYKNKEAVSGLDTILEFRNVGLTYEGAGEESLSDISFSVKRGETVGIIGGTGSGKTSLVHLISRFYDATRGEVLLDGNDIKNYTYEAIQSKVSVVLQKAQLFRGTIRDNLKLGNQEAGDEELYQALEISQSKEFVNEKEGKLDFLIEQDGRNLSGGQKQRLTIARALVKHSDILILDDSASALDYATDAKLRVAIKEMEDRPTVFIVSQRTSSLLYADKIIVLEDGNMVGVGKHEELLQTCEIYQEIYHSQFKREV